MSEVAEERVYTINLSRVVLASRNRRSKRAINMIKEFAMRHMKISKEDIRISEELNKIIWKRGIRKPPRRVRVKMVREPDGIVRIEPYEEIKEESKDKEEESKE